MTDTRDPERILRHIQRKNVRVRLHYGDPETGRDWLEEFGVEGYIGQSMGDRPVFLVVATTRSRGGESVLTDSILRIRRVGEGSQQGDLYRHPAYHTGQLKTQETEDGAEVLRDGELHAAFRDLEAAQRWRRRMLGPEPDTVPATPQGALRAFAAREGTEALIDALERIPALAGALEDRDYRDLLAGAPANLRFRVMALMGRAGIGRRPRR